MIRMRKNGSSQQRCIIKSWNIVDICKFCITSFGCSIEQASISELPNNSSTPSNPHSDNRYADKQINFETSLMKSFLYHKEQNDKIMKKILKKDQKMKIKTKIRSVQIVRQAILWLLDRNGYNLNNVKKY